MPAVSEVDTAGVFDMNHSGEFERNNAVGITPGHQCWYVDALWRLYVGNRNDQYLGCGLGGSDSRLRQYLGHRRSAKISNDNSGKRVLPLIKRSKFVVIEGGSQGIAWTHAE